MDVISGWIGSVTKKKEDVKPTADDDPTAKPNDNNSTCAEEKEQTPSEGGDVSTPTSTGSGSITSGPDSEPASTPESEGPDPENKAAAIAEELEHVSNKAIQSAKTFGNFLFSVANKAGKTVSETAKQIKHTVEENSILTEFNKEQETFSKEKKEERNSGNAVPPWVGYNEEDAMKQQILALSSDKRNFLRNPPSGVQFTFDFDSYYPVALATLNEDPNLQKMRFDLVPKSVNEENFWRNYFYRVSLIKQSTQLTSLAQETGSTGESSTKSSRKGSKDETGKSGLIGSHVDDSDMPQDSPNHEFVSDSYSQNIDMEDIKKGMKQLGVTSANSQPSNDEEWEKELQQELQEYEVVTQGGTSNVDDPEWEKEMEQMLSQQAAQ